MTHLDPKKGRVLLSLQLCLVLRLLLAVALFLLLAVAAALEALDSVPAARTCKEEAFGVFGGVVVLRGHGLAQPPSLA